MKEREPSSFLVYAFTRKCLGHHNCPFFIVETFSLYKEENKKLFFLDLSAIAGSSEKERKESLEDFQQLRREREEKSNERERKNK